MIRRRFILFHFDEEFVRQAGDHIAFFLCFSGLYADEVGAVGIHDGDRLALNADRVCAVRICDDNLLRACVSCERDVVELHVILCDDSVTHIAVRTCEKKRGADPAEEEQCADEG